MNLNFKKASLLSAAAFMGLMACKNDAKEDTALVEEESIPGINLEYMNTDVKPNDDFFNYVNGTWLKTTEIPDDQSTWGSFNELRKKTDADALSILEAAMSDNKDMNKIQVLPGSDQEKAVFLYQTIMDTVGRNNQGLDPIKPYLTKIDAIENINDLQAYMIEMEPLGGGGLYGFGVGSDPKDR